MSFAIPSAHIQNSLSVYVMSNYLLLCFSIQLKTPSCQPSSTTPTAPRCTSNSRPLMSCTWPVATSCRLLTALTCRRLRGRTRSSPSWTRWWAWWREWSRSVTHYFLFWCVDCLIEHNVIDCFLSQCVRLPLVWLCSFIMLLFHTDILLVKCLNCVLFNSPCSLYSYIRLHL